MNRYPDATERAPRPAVTAAGSGPVEEDRISVLLIASALLRRAPLILGMAVLFAVAGAVYALPKVQYTAMSSFQPAVESSGNSRLAGLASQFGISVPGAGGSGESIQFYSQLLRSRDLLTEAVTSEYTLPPADDDESVVEGTLVDIYEIEAPTAQQAVRTGVRRLSRNVQVNPDLDANLVTVTTRADRPELAVAINSRLLDLVNRFNIEKRQSRAASERSFVEERLAESQRQLAAAESDLQSFLARNRTYESSPELNFEARRLQRRVDLAQQVHLSLAQAHEQARIDEVRNTPVFTVIDQPSFGGVDSKVRLYGVLGFLFGGLVGVVVAFGIEAKRRLDRERPPEYEEFLAARRELFRKLNPRRRGQPAVADRAGES